MLHLLLGAVAVATIGRPHVRYDLAFVARFYYPAFDERRSHYKLYVSDLNGKHRKRIADAEDIGDVRWFAGDLIAWVKQPQKGPDKLYVSDPPYDQVRLVRRAKEIRLEAGYLGGTRGPLPVTVNGKRYLLCAAPDRLQRDRRKTQPAEWVPARNLRLTNKGAFIDLQRGSRKASLLVTNARIEFETCVGSYSPIDCIDYIHFREHAAPPSDVPKWVIGHAGLTAHEGVAILFLVDWRHKRARIVPADLGDVTVAPERGLFAGATDRYLTTYKDLTLWTEHIWVGSLKTGRARRVVTGRVAVFEAVIRP